MEQLDHKALSSESGTELASEPERYVSKHDRLTLLGATRDGRLGRVAGEAATVMTGSDPEIFSLSVQDLDEYEQLTTPEGWDIRFLQLSAGRFSGQYHGLVLPGVYLSLVDYGRSSIDITGTAPDHLVPILLPLKIGRSLRARGQIATEANAILPRPADEVDYAIEGGLRFAGIYLARETHLGIRRAVYGADAEAPDAAGRSGLMAGPAIVELKSRVGEVFRTNPASTARAPAAIDVNGLSQYIPSRLMTALTEQNLDLPNGGRLCSKDRFLYARRARDFMEQNLDEPLNLGELSAEIGVSLRTLHYAFRHYFGATPAKYHMLMRLRGARQELKQRDPAETTVTEVATNWGFWHFGRFSQVYKSQFAEMPSQTLAHQPAKVFMRPRQSKRPTGSHTQLPAPSLL